MKENQASQILQAGGSAKENFMEWGTATSVEGKKKSVESESHLNITQKLQPDITNEALGVL